MLMLLLTLFLQTPAYRLVVIGGSGTGVYPCGAKVAIIGDRTHGAEVFAAWHVGWSGDAPVERVHQRKATITMPCHDVTVEAKFTAKPPKRKS